MTAHDKIKKVNEWQECKYVHELTCANKSTHQPLVAMHNNIDNTAFLRCPTCGYVQIYIPEVVLKADVNKIIEENDKLFKQ